MNKFLTTAITLYSCTIRDVNSFTMPLGTQTRTTSGMVLNAESATTDMSESLPFMKRPTALTGKYAGDVGFDPFGFAVDDATLFNYREAEIKHARLAMLAAAGWPLSEVLDKQIANTLHMDPLLDSSDRVPSLLNGGLGKVSPLYWIACLGVCAAIDIYGLLRINAENNYTPGDLGFDPLGLLPQEEEKKKNMELAEIKHGRLAMIAVVAFAVQEAVSENGVVNQTPFFFFPLSS